MLTFVLLTCFALTWSESVATTKFVNLFSSLIATVIFYRQGLVSLQLGFPLTLSMMLGAWLGASLAIRHGDVWIRRLFACVVVVLALKLLMECGAVKIRGQHEVAPDSLHHDCSAREFSVREEKIQTPDC